MQTLKVKISDIIKEYYDNAGQLNSIAFTVGIDDYTTSITAEMIESILENYASWEFTMFYHSGGVQPIYQSELFITKWNKFKSFRKASWDRMAYSMLQEYIPTENYNRHEDITVKNPLVETEVTIASRTNQDSIAQKTVHEKESSYQTTTPLESGSTVADAYIDNHTLGGGTDTTKVKAHNVETVNHTHGNIGVTQNSELIKNELYIRAMDLTSIFVNEFITEYCTLTCE